MLGRLSGFAVTEVVETPRQDAMAGIDLYVGAYLVGFAAGAASAGPVVSFLYFSGPLGSLREAAALPHPALASWWARGIFVAMAIGSLVKGGYRSPMLSAACFAGVVWLAQALLGSGVDDSHPFIPLALSALFGGLWLAASWPAATSHHRRIAVAVAAMSLLAALIGPISATRIRLG